MLRKLSVPIVSLLLILCIAPGARGELMRGGATLSSVSSVIKISREGNGLDSMVEGEVLYIFTETGDPVAQILVKDIYSDVIHSEPLPDAVARQIRESGTILVFCNLREYGDFIKAYLNGSMDSFRDFIARYPESELREEAQRVFDGMVYRPYKMKGTPGAFDDFIQRNPDNFYVESAVKRRDYLLYLPVKGADRISAYRSFISAYPDNLHAVEAKKRIKAILSTYEDTKLEEAAKYPRIHLGKKVKFSGTLHSALPIYVEGPSVGRKTALFRSPRNSTDHLNIQVEEGGIVLWRLFASREDVSLVETVHGLKKGDDIIIYGVVFDTLGGAPWIDVDDIERF